MTTGRMYPEHVPPGPWWTVAKAVFPKVDDDHERRFLAHLIHHAMLRDRESLRGKLTDALSSVDAALAVVHGHLDDIEGEDE